MVKVKNKNRNLAEKISNKKKSLNAKKINPFEVHINKEKLKVLGRKQKNDRGLPGVSRAKALNKRKSTLLQEYKLQNKANRFVDKRIGERNSGLTEEERSMARFAAVRIKAHKRKSIFNLADDELLTHRGQTLNEIEKFDDPRSDDEESLDGTEQTGKLDSDFVEEAHFGGGVLSKTGVEGAKSHKDLINQLIVESKKRKAEKQLTKEKTLQLTEKLDTEWKDLIPLVNKNFKKSTDKVDDGVDEYDKVMRELRFEARGKPSDRLKSEDEQAKEEKERLENLENDRLSRMKGFVETTVSVSNKHRSADDLDDDFAYESDQDVMLSYNEKGESNIPLLKADEVVPEIVENEALEESGSSDEVQTESEDDLSDLKEESSDSDHDSEIEQPKQTQIKEDLQKRKDIMEMAREELPYTFQFPETYEDLQETCKNYSPIHHSIIIERLIKCTHPSLNESNKEKLGILFAYLLQYINDLSIQTEPQSCVQAFDALVPQLFDLAQLNSEEAQRCILEVIKEKHLNYRSNKKSYPELDVLLFLKLVSCLFPTSDFRHPVVTPCFVFMDQMLIKCKVRTGTDIAYGMFIVTLILEYTYLSKRYLPSAITYLSGILHMAIPKSGIKLIKVLPPFRAVSNALVLYKNCGSLKMSLKLEVTDLVATEITEDFKIRAVYTVLRLLEEFATNLKNSPSFNEIFHLPLHYLKQIPVKNYPNEVQELIISIQKVCQSENNLEYIVMEAKRPKALRLYEPNIEKVYDTKKHKVMSKEKAEREKLLHKLKRERKGAMREIRRDKEFLGRIKIKQKIQSDKERLEKVKKIYAEANIQQHELNALDRKKKRNK